MRTDWRRGKVTRRLAGDEPEVNEEWNCDKGRWAFSYTTQGDRITHPAGPRGRCAARRPAGPRRSTFAATRPRRRARRRRCRRAAGWPAHRRGRLRVREVRPRRAGHQRHRHARPRAQRRGARLPRVLGRRPADGGHLRRPRPRVRRSCSSGSRPRRSRRSSSSGCARTPATTALRSSRSRPTRPTRVRKAYATLLRAVPGTEGALLEGLVSRTGLDAAGTAAAEALSAGGGLILVGERLATSPGGLTAAAALADATGAKLAWIPRRAGERGAVEAGALPVAAARRPPGRRRPRRWPTTGACARCRPSPDATPTRCWPLPPRVRSAPSSSVASTRSTCPTRRSRSTRSTRSASWSASRSAPRRSPTGPTWSSRSRRWSRSPARSSTGRAGPRPFPETLNGTGSLADHRVLDRLADELDEPLGLLRPGRRCAPRSRGCRATPASVPAAAKPRRARRAVKLKADEAVLVVVAPAARRGRPAGRRAVPRGDRPAVGRPAQRRHGSRRRCRRGWPALRRHRAWHDHVAAGDRRPARPGRLGPRALRRQLDPPRPRRRRRVGRPHRHRRHAVQEASS